MTRINLVPVKELCDQHLLAEHRELTRIPNSVISGKLVVEHVPVRYTVRTEDNPAGGAGHVKFFYDKMMFLFNRYVALTHECFRRGFNVEYKFPDEIFDYLHLMNDYIPTSEALALNRKRIAERLPNNARWTNHEEQ